MSSPFLTRCHEIRLCRAAAVCNRAHIPKERQRADLIGILPDPCPGDISVVRAAQVDLSGRRFVALARNAPRQPQLFRILLQNSRSQLGGKLSESDVARMRQRPGKTQASVHAVADDLLPADDGFAAALERARLHTFDGFSAAAAVTSLKIEPGVYAASKKRLRYTPS